MFANVIQALTKKQGNNNFHYQVFLHCDELADLSKRNKDKCGNVSLSGEKREV